MSIKAKREAEKARDASVRARWEAAKVVSSRGMDAKINRIEEAEGRAIAAAAQEKKEAREEQRRIAEEKQQAAAAAQQQALKGFRSGEAASYAVTPKVEEKPWWGSLANVSMGLWSAGASMLGSALSLVGGMSGGGGSKLTAPIKYDPWPPSEWGWVKALNDWLNKPWPWEKQQPRAVPNISATQTAAFQSALTQVYGVQTANAPTYTVTPSPTSTPTIMPTLLPTSMWVTYGANFHSGNPNGPIEFSVPTGSVVTPTGNTQTAVVDEKNILYKEVKLLDGTTGWVVSNYLEGVVTSSSSLVANPDKKVVINPALSYINTALTNPADTPAQYLSLDNPSLQNGIIKAGGDIKTNLCGPFSVAYITGRPIETVISDWITKSSDTSAAKNNIKKNDATGVNDIKGMLDLYHCTYTKESFLDVTFQDKTAPYDPIIISPGRIQAQLDLGKSLILGVGIDGQTGTINGGDIAHWVVVDKIEPQGPGGGNVLLQNSFSNAQQVIPYDQLQAGWDRFIVVNHGITGSPPMGVFVDLNSCDPYIPPTPTP